MYVQNRFQIMCRFVSRFANHLRLMRKFNRFLGMQFMMMSMPLPKITKRFVAEHPFLYLIKEQSSVVFMGRQVNASN